MLIHDKELSICMIQSLPGKKVIENTSNEIRYYKRFIHSERVIWNIWLIHIL